MISNDSVASTLYGLIETCREGEEGFRLAAERVEVDYLKILFRNYSQQRAQLAAELEKLLRHSDTQTEANGSVAKALHRSAIVTRAASDGSDETVVLNECERGEDVALEAYEEALSQSLPPSIRQVVSRQCAAIRAAHDRIRELEESRS